ncbi:MAG: GNAT family N-acetyltransferase [Burkholderiales bacterium]
MSSSAPTAMLNIRHLPDRGRFEVVVDGHVGELEYRLADGVMSILHTGVAAAIEGRGIAAALTRAALAHAQATGLKVRPLCSYARTYMVRHPETAALLT